jgi:hypothetical protein
MFLRQVHFRLGVLGDATEAFELLLVGHLEESLNLPDAFHEDIDGVDEEIGEVRRQPLHALNHPLHRLRRQRQNLLEHLRHHVAGFLAEASACLRELSQFRPEFLGAPHVAHHLIDFGLRLRLHQGGVVLCQFVDGSTNALVEPDDGPRCRR